jgi:hypothetical protein
MKVVLAGQLERVYANALARAEGDAEVPANDNGDGPQSEKDRLFFHRAATLAVLSDTVVTAPDWYLTDGEDEEDRAGRLSNDLSFAPGMPLTAALWAALYDDAAGLVKAVDFLGNYSRRSQATLDEIAAPDAWVEDDSPRSLRRANLGASHAYLTDLLLQPFLAWQAGAVLVIAEADCHLLADIATFLVERGWPRPFPIPDLREIVRPAGALVSGKLPNLGFEEFADVEAGRQDRGVRTYARRLQSIVEAPELFDVGERLETALAAARPAGSCRNGLDDIAVVVEHAGILSNAAVQVTPRMTTLGRYVRRRFAPQGLRTLVLV